MFITNKNKSFSRDDILNIIWGENYFGTDRVVDDLVRRLRLDIVPSVDIAVCFALSFVAGGVLILILSRIKLIRNLIT